MYNPYELEGTPTLSVIRMRNKYKDYWKDKSDWYWFFRLLLELLELAGSLLKIHKDPPEWELTQIASICINWLHKKKAP